MAVLDLKSAYRSVHIRDSEHCLTGLSWKFPGDSTPTFMFDSRLPFGSRKSPAIFNRFTQAVARFMIHKGHNIVVYLDDFWLCGPNLSLQGSSGWPCLTPPHSGLPSQLEENSRRLSKAGFPWHNDRYCMRRTVPQTWQINGAYWSHTEIPQEETCFMAPVGTALWQTLLGSTCDSLGNYPYQTNIHPVVILKASGSQRTNIRYQMGPHLVAIMAAKWPE